MPWEGRTTARGQSYSQWVEPTPRIPPVILNSIIYLYGDKDNAETGVEQGASGFLLGMPSVRVKGASHIYGITNAHVIEDGHTIIRLNLKYPNGNARTDSFPLTNDDWIVHEKHDVAVYPFARDLDTSLFNLAILDTGYLMTHEEFGEQDIGEGGDLFYVGRFMSHAGKFYNTPPVRFGNILMVPNEDEPIEYKTGTRSRSQVGFLVEARSRSGYSGSPVFFLHQHAMNSPRTVILPSDVKILGVDWGHIPERVLLQDPQGYFHGQKWYVEVHAGMMGVVPAWYLGDFIKTNLKLIAQRERDEEYYADDARKRGRADLVIS